MKNLKDLKQTQLQNLPWICFQRESAKCNKQHMKRRFMSGPLSQKFVIFMIICGLLCMLALGFYYFVIHCGFCRQHVFEPLLNEKDTKLLLDTLEVAVKAMEAANITYLMYGGTLLGSYRHHGLIPWDDDVDLFVPETEKENLEQALSKLEPQYTLHTKRIWKFYSQESYHFDIYPSNYPFIDVFFYRENATHIYDTRYDTSFCYPKSLVMPLTRRPFEKMMLKAPHNTEAVLKINYDTEKCQTKMWSHKYDIIHFFHYTVDCHILWNQYPFVFRDEGSKGNKNVEVLKLGGTVLRSLRL